MYILLGLFVYEDYTYEETIKYDIFRKNYEEKSFQMPVLFICRIEKIIFIHIDFRIYIVVGQVMIIILDSGSPYTILSNVIRFDVLILI